MQGTTNFLTSFMAQSLDPKAFQELVIRNQQMVFGVCRRILRNQADAEDVAQETFIKFARKAGNILGNPVAWLHECALVTALELRRKANGRPCSPTLSCRS